MNRSPATIDWPAAPAPRATDAPDVSVVVPTYCEAENLPILIPRIVDSLKQAGFAGEIIVVDDDSPDSTEDVCRQLSRKFPVRLLVRKLERGLSSAVIHGMRHAQGSVLVVMDADLSHPAERIPDLVRAVKSGRGEFVIGSRYVPGGRTDDEWGVFRWLNSKAATWLARPLTSAKDPMAGFFALRRSTFEAATDLNPVGYKIGLELIVKCRPQVAEVPIEFRNRVFGQSKLTLREQLNYVRHVIRLYEYKLRQVPAFAKFCLVGASGMMVDLSLLSMLQFATPYYVARAFAIWVAMSWNFQLNRRFTFSISHSGQLARQYVLFCLSCLLGASVNWSASVALINSVSFFDRHRLFAALCGVATGTIFNFVMSSRLVFAPSRSPDQPTDVAHVAGTIAHYETHRPESRKPNGESGVIRPSTRPTKRVPRSPPVAYFQG